MKNEKEKKVKKSDLPLYAVWNSMRQRCYNENYSDYKYYGAKGIKIEDWETFDEFYNWAINEAGYELGLSIERLDNSKSYSKNNCKFVTMKEQARNKSSNVWVTIKGKTQCLMDWSKELNIDRGTLKYRLLKGWDEERLLQPAR